MYHVCTRKIYRNILVSVSILFVQLLINTREYEGSTEVGVKYDSCEFKY